MLRTIIALAICTAVAVAKPSERLLEGEITQALQDYLTPLDPSDLAAITALNITTDHSNIVFSSSDNTFVGFSAVSCLSFTPPIPLLSHAVSMTLKFDNLDAHAETYSMEGTFNGAPYSASGLGDLVISGMQIKIDFKAASYHLTTPLSFCIEAGSLVVDIAADSIVANFVGADEINEDINNNAENLLEQIEAQINAEGTLIEEAINAALCTAP